MGTSGRPLRAETHAPSASNNYEPIRILHAEMTGAMLPAATRFAGARADPRRGPPAANFGKLPELLRDEAASGGHQCAFRPRAMCVSDGGPAADQPHVHDRKNC